MVKTSRYDPTRITRVVHKGTSLFTKHISKRQKILYLQGASPHRELGTPKSKSFLFNADTSQSLLFKKITFENLVGTVLQCGLIPQWKIRNLNPSLTSLNGKLKCGFFFGILREVYTFIFHHFSLIISHSNQNTKIYPKSSPFSLYSSPI